MTPFARKAAAVLAAAFFLCPSLAFAQGSVLQSGPVTPGHVAIWSGNGVLRDASTIVVTQSGPVVAGHDVKWLSSGVLVDAGYPSEGPYLPLAGGTLLGPLTLNADPAQPFQAATKHYTDTGDATNAAAAAAAQSTANSAASAASAAQGTADSAATAAATAQAAANTAQTTANTAQTTANAAVPKAGGTMTGALILNANPSANLGAATKQTVDAAQTTANAALPKSGGTMTGALTLSGPPINPLDATTKTYVDSASALNIGRNKLHNPLFTIAQRGVGPWTAAGYTLDRWLLNGVHSNGSMSVSQVALTDANRTSIGDQEAQFGYQYTFVGGTGAADTDVFAERIENVRRLAATTVTVSFWAFAASGTPKVGVSIDQNFGTGGSPSTAVLGAGQSVTISTTALRYTATFVIASATGKTIGTNNDSNTQLNIWESSGTTNATRAGSIGVQSGTVTVWGVQLEETAAASPLEKRDPELELALCQRFYQIGNFSLFGWAGSAGGTTSLIQSLQVTMRTGPTVTFNATTQTNATASVSSFGPSGVGISAAATAIGSFGIGGTFAASSDL